MPYICKIRTDVPDSILQVLDLDPNTSQRSLVYEPPGQTKYVNRVVSNVVATVGAGPITTIAAYTGLAAYLIDRVEDTDNADAALTAAFANAIAASLIATLDGGGEITIAVVNAAIQASTGGAATLTGGDSTATLADVLRVLAGGAYNLPVNTQVEDGGNDFDATISGSFAGTDRHTHESGALQISLGEGHLAAFIASTFVYGTTTGAALVVLDDDGTVMS